MRNWEKSIFAQKIVCLHTLNCPIKLKFWEKLDTDSKFGPKREWAPILGTIRVNITMYQELQNWRLFVLQWPTSELFVCGEICHARMVPKISVHFSIGQDSTVDFEQFFSR